MNWINVKEGLPKKSGKYIVAIPLMKFITILTFQNGYWYDLGEFDEMHWDKSVTHWMSLPELPI